MHSPIGGSLRITKRIAYIIGTYPNLTTTFIDREILEARRLGLNVRLIASTRPQSHDFDPEVRILMKETTYLRPVRIGPLMRANWYFISRHFRRYFGTVIYLLTRAHPSLMARAKTLIHFGGGVLAADILRKDGVQHVHAHFADSAGVIAMVIQRLLGVPYSLTAHAHDIYRSPAFLAAKIQSAKFTTTCTASNKSYLEMQTGCSIELIYHGLDFAALQPDGAVNVRPTRPLFLSVGRLVEKKGFMCLIRACALLKARGFDFTCEIVGEGPDRLALEALVRELRLDSVVKLCGALPHAEVVRKYECASCFVLACTIAADGDRDGIPNVILEAMAFALPVISTNVSGIPEVVRDSETGVLVEPQKSQDLSEVMEELLRNPEKASRLGRNAAGFVRREFDIRRNVLRLMELLLE